MEKAELGPLSQELAFGKPGIPLRELEIVHVKVIKRAGDSI